jgi:hypothetical protein
MKKLYRIILLLLLIVLAAAAIRRYDRSHDLTQATPAPETSLTQIQGSTGNYATFYYDQLSEAEQRAYEQLLQAADAYKEEIPVLPIPLDSFYAAESALTMDHPEFYWMASFVTHTRSNQVESVTFDVPEDAAETQAALDAAAEEILTEILQENASDYDKVKSIFLYIVQNTDYGTDEGKEQDIRSVLLDHQSVCAGYAKTFEFLCRKSDIDCTYVQGYSTEGESHAWNLVEIGGKGYWVDVTWGDPMFEESIAGTAPQDFVNYAYLCVDDEEIFRTHRIETGVIFENYHQEDVFSYPSCSDPSLNYYRLNGCYFEGYDRTEVSRSVWSQMEANPQSPLQMQFATEEAYQEAAADLFSDTDPYFVQILKERRPFLWVVSTYRYFLLEDSNSICIYLN